MPPRRINAHYQSAIDGFRGRSERQLPDKQVWDEDRWSADDLIGQRRLRLSDVDFSLDHGQGHEASVVFARPEGAEGVAGDELEPTSAPVTELWVPLDPPANHWVLDELSR